MAFSVASIVVYGLVFLGDVLLARDCKCCFCFGNVNRNYKVGPEIILQGLIHIALLSKAHCWALHRDLEQGGHGPSRGRIESQVRVSYHGSSCKG